MTAPAKTIASAMRMPDERLITAVGKGRPDRLAGPPGRRERGGMRRSRALQPEDAFDPCFGSRGETLFEALIRGAPADRGERWIRMDDGGEVLGTQSFRDGKRQLGDELAGMRTDDGAAENPASGIRQDLGETPGLTLGMRP